MGQRMKSPRRVADFIHRRLFLPAKAAAIIVGSFRIISSRRRHKNFSMNRTRFVDCYNRKPVMSIELIPKIPQGP